MAPKPSRNPSAIASSGVLLVVLSTSDHENDDAGRTLVLATVCVALVSPSAITTSTVSTVRPGA